MNSPSFAPSHGARSRTGRAAAWLLGAAVALPTPRAVSAEDAPRFEFGGTHRTRYESLDPEFRAGLDADDELLALQTTLHFDVRLGKLEFLAEIMDSRGERNDSGMFVTTTIVNSLEPIQTYVAWRRPNTFEPTGESTLRVGRMTLDLGKRRLLARNRFRNTVNTFYGADWAWRDADGRSARLFYFVPGRLLPTGLDALLDNHAALDHPAHGSALFGGYYQLPPFADETVLETYALDYDVDSSPDGVAASGHWVSAGARVYRNPEPRRLSYEVEAILQTGTVAGVAAGAARTDLDHRASLLHAEIGYTLAAKAKPTIALQYDRASGDEDPNDLTDERFNTLFGARRFDFGPTDIYGPFARANLETPGLRLTFAPAPRWQSMFAYRSFRLAEARDAWVGSGWRDPSGASGRSLGRQLEGSFTWAAIANRLSVETGFALLELGRFARETQGAAFRGDPRYFYAAVTTTF